MTNEKELREIGTVCAECGISANVLTCLKKYGMPPKKLAFDVSTSHEGKCDYCGETKYVTQVRDFFYPDFSLLKKFHSHTQEVVEKIEGLEKNYIWDNYNCSICGFDVMEGEGHRCEYYNKALYDVLTLLKKDNK